MKNILNRTIYAPGNVFLREGEEGKASRTIEGYAILFDTPSALMSDDGHEEIREVISRDAISRDLLDASDIKMTMFHDRQLILARSKQGKGTLTYDVDDIGVRFTFEAPFTDDGDKAVELVRRGDIDGCSFAFSADYRDGCDIEVRSEEADGKTHTTFVVRHITGLYDFTLTPDPAYPDTSVAARELREVVEARSEKKPEAAPAAERPAYDGTEAARMRAEANKELF